MFLRFGPVQCRLGRRGRDNQNCIQQHERAVWIPHFTLINPYQLLSLLSPASALLVRRALPPHRLFCNDFILSKCCPSTTCSLHSGWLCTRLRTVNYALKSDCIVLGHIVNLNILDVQWMIRSHACNHLNHADAAPPRLLTTGHSRVSQDRGAAYSAR